MDKHVDIESLINLSYKITNLVEELNNCIRWWYHRFFPSHIQAGEFKVCCNEDEIKIIRECLNIFKENNSDIDEDNALRAIIGYYYSTQVLEYNVLVYESEGKYLKIVKTDASKSEFEDNKGNKYSWVVDIRPNSPLFSKVDMTITPILNKRQWKQTHYFINTRTELPWYIYNRVNDHDYDLEKLTTVKGHFGCLNEFYTQNAKKIVDEITTSDAEWVSSIRKKILNMNPEPFNGGKKRSNKSRKNIKRKMKKTSRRKMKKTTNKNHNKL
jgi:hypothetical protein